MAGGDAFGINVEDFDYLVGGSQVAQQQAAAASGATDSLAATGAQTQVVGFDASGQPEAKNVAGDGNGVGLAFSGNTLTATLTQGLKTTSTPTFAGVVLTSTFRLGGGAIASALLSATAALDFPNTAAQTSSDLTITVTGAAVGDAVFLGVPNGSVAADSSFSAWVSAADTVTVRFNNYSAGAIDPASGTFRVVVLKF